MNPILSWAKVETVEARSPAAEKGIAIGDEIIRLENAAPIPKHPELLLARRADPAHLAEHGGAYSSLRYFIRGDCAHPRHLVVHELGHTAQYERLGGFESFLRQYLFECLTIGYPAAPME